MVTWSTKTGAVAIVSGARTPFTKSGTGLRQVHVTELAQIALRETLSRAGWPAARLDEVILGNVAMPADATNPARVAAIYAGVPASVPALTVQRNCASGMESIAQAAFRIQSGQATAILAGGAESMSTIPLLMPTEALQPMATLFKARSPWQKLVALSAFRPRHFRPLAGLELGLTDPTCGLIMGKTAEILAGEFGISRDEQDQFALESHQKATDAIDAGEFDQQITPVYAGDRFQAVCRDIGPRVDQSSKALARLKPIFDRRNGSVTVGNSCQITDGAVALLLMDSRIARAEGLEVLGYVRASATAGLDPKRMGLGPVLAIDQLLQSTGLALEKIDLFEINEAFAAQVLACHKAMSSDSFAQQYLGRSRAIGVLDPERVNIHGGAIALGHPVGATGTRIVLNLLMAMKKRNVEFGIASLCVGGGQGAAICIQNN